MEESGGMEGLIFAFIFVIVLVFLAGITTVRGKHRVRRRARAR